MKLKQLTVNAFKKISPASPVVIDFSQSSFVKLAADNMAGKTSLLEALLVACGHLSKDDKNFVNLDSGKIDIDLEFKGNDNKNYQVRVTKSQFKLIYEGEVLEEPITKLKKLLGIPGVNPIDIKNAPLSKIVKWLASYTKRGADEYEAEYRRMKEGIKKWKSARADANRNYKALKEVLTDDHIYKNWEQSEAKYAKKQDIKALSVALDEAGKRSDNLIKAEARLKELKSREQQLLAELAEVQAGITKGEKYIEQNKSAKSDYDQIRAQYDQAAQFAAQYEKWQQIKRQKAEMDEYETLYQVADAKEKEILEEVKQLQAEIIPDVRGVELVLEDEYEDGKLVRPEGVYHNGVNSAQMSETQWISVVFSILKKNKCPILVVDNYQSLGTMGVKIIEQFHKEGAYIFAAEMNRQSKELQIEYI